MIQYEMEMFDEIRQKKEMYDKIEQFKELIQHLTISPAQKQ